MEFRTEVPVKPQAQLFALHDSLFTMGSCFAGELAEKMIKGGFQVLHNPFGTLFNPVSIVTAVRRIHSAKEYSEDDLIAFEEQIISLDHHSSYDGRYAHLVLEKINADLQRANDFLQRTRWVIITFGSSYLYRFLPKDRFAANCRKIPAKHFEKNMLGVGESVAAMEELVALLRDICPEDVQLYFTVSPVRHTKDGFVENQLSKARLLTAIHEVVGGGANRGDVHYFPVYEIMMDELRDYRFYKPDMIHPTEQAVDYIFSKFVSSALDQNSRDFLAENYKIHDLINHKPKVTDAAAELARQAQIRQRIDAQQKLVHHKIFPDFNVLP